MLSLQTKFLERASESDRRSRSRAAKEKPSELLRHSLARLSPKHGEVIDLLYFHGKSVTEVAEIVGIAEAGVCCHGGRH